MGIIALSKNYLLWHYSVAYRDMWSVWLNYLWFVNHLFSVPDILRSWFAPFKRMQEDRPSLLLHPQDFFGAFVVNLIMRIVGMVIRTALLAIALLFFLTVFIGGLLFFCLWTMLPIAILLILRSSVFYLFQ